MLSWPSFPVLLVLVLASFPCFPVLGVLDSFSAPHFSLLFLFKERLIVRDCLCAREYATGLGHDINQDVMRQLRRFFQVFLASCAFCAGVRQLKSFLGTYSSTVVRQLKSAYMGLCLRDVSECERQERVPRIAPANESVWKDLLA
jgi:hypothetical protein